MITLRFSTLKLRALSPPTATCTISREAKSQANKMTVTMKYKIFKENYRNKGLDTKITVSKIHKEI